MLPPNPLPLNQDILKTCLQHGHRACVCYVSAWVQARERDRALHVLEWKSGRSLAVQLSAGFYTLYSLFAWLTLDALIAPRWLFLVFWKSRPHSKGKAQGAHGGRVADRCTADRMYHKNTKQKAPQHPNLFTFFLQHGFVCCILK